MRPERPPEEWLLKAWDGDTLVDLIYCPKGLPVDDDLIARGEELSVLGMDIRVMALEDVMATKLMALTEHSLRYESLLQIARALREQIDWQASGAHAGLAVRPRVLRAARRARHRPGRRRAAGAAPDAGPRRHTAGFHRDTGRVGAPHGSQHDHPRPSAPAGRRQAGAWPRPVGLPEPRSRPSSRPLPPARRRSPRCSPRRRHRVDSAEGLDHDEREALKADVDRVREALNASDIAQNGTRAVAVYACGPADLLEVVALRRPIDSAVVLERSPHVEPLIARRRLRALVRRARQPPQRAAVLRRRRRPRGDRPRRGRRAQPARPGRLVAGALPARRREGEGRPPRPRRATSRSTASSSAASTGC